MIKIIGFLGVIGSGKTYCAEHYAKEEGVGVHCIILNIAQRLREMCYSICGKQVEPENYELFKVSEFHNENLGFNFTGRDMLIRISPYIRRIDENFWINCLIEDMKKLGQNGTPTLFLIPDIRYPNEVKRLCEFCDENNYPLEFKFCNYISEKYDAKKPDISEKLAQDILKMPEIDPSKYIQDITHLARQLK